MLYTVQPPARSAHGAKRFAMLGGAAMLGMGLTAFIPAFSRSSQESGLPALRISRSYGKFLGLFPLNIFNKSALCLFGLGGILASRAKTGTPAVVYSRAVASTMGPLAILGAIPRTRTLFGYWPLFGGEVAAHGTFAALGAFSGLGRRAA